MEIFCALGCLALAVLVVIGHYAAKSEDKAIGEQWAALARERGWSYTADDPAVFGPLRGLASLAKGDNERASSVMRWKEDAAELCVVDHYRTYGHRNAPLYNTIAVFRIPGRAMPRCYVLKRGLDNAIHSMMTGDAVDLGVEDAFTERFAVYGDDADAIRALFAPSLRAFLAQERELLLSFEASDDRFAVHYDERVRPEDIDTLLEHGRAIAQRLA